MGRSDWRPEVKRAMIAVVSWLGASIILPIPLYFTVERGDWFSFAGYLLAELLFTITLGLALWWALPRSASSTRQRRQ